MKFTLRPASLLWRFIRLLPCSLLPLLKLRSRSFTSTNACVNLTKILIDTIYDDEKKNFNLNNFITKYLVLINCKSKCKQIFFQIDFIKRFSCTKVNIFSRKWCKELNEWKNSTEQSNLFLILTYNRIRDYPRIHPRSNLVLDLWVCYF